MRNSKLISLKIYEFLGSSEESPDEKYPDEEAPDEKYPDEESPGFEISKNVKKYVLLKLADRRIIFNVMTKCRKKQLLISRL